MKKLLFIFAFCLFFAQVSFSQAVNVTGICVGSGDPNGSGRNITFQTQLIECSVYKDTLNKNLWVYDNTLTAPNRWVRVPVDFNSSDWIAISNMGTAHSAFLLQNGATNGQVIKWNGTAWVPANDAGGTTYTAGTGIDINGSNVISATDPSQTNEGSLTVGAGTATTSVITSNTPGSNQVTFSAGTNITLAESGNTITISSSDTALPVYTSNAAALAALGTGKKYRVGFGSTEGSVGTVKETY